MPGKVLVEFWRMLHLRAVSFVSAIAKLCSGIFRHAQAVFFVKVWQHT